MYLLTNQYGELMTMTKFETVDDNKIVVSIAKFKNNLSTSIDKKTFNKKDVSKINQFIIDIEYKGNDKWKKY